MVYENWEIIQILWIETQKCNIWGLKCHNLHVFLGKFLKFGKCTCVKKLTNIMPAAEL